MLVTPWERSRGDAADVCRGAAHVEPNSVVEAGQSSDRLHGEHAASGSRQDGVGGSERLGGAQASVRAHRERGGRNAVASKRRMEQGGDRCVYERGLDSIEVSHLGAHLVSECDVGGGRLAEPTRNLVFMGAVRSAVEQHDSDGIEPREVREVVACQRLELAALGVQPAAQLEDGIAERLGPGDLGCEQLGPRHVAEDRKVAEAAGHQQCRAAAGALEERIRRDRGAEGQTARREVSDDGVVGGDLLDPDGTARVLSHDVGERTPAVDEGTHVRPG